MKRLLMVLTLIAFLMVTLQSVRAAGDAPYTLDWWTVDGGGGVSSGGAYSLSGTAGQAEAGTLRGSEAALAGGFWAALEEAWEKLFLPLLTK